MRQRILSLMIASALAGTVALTAAAANDDRDERRRPPPIGSGATRAAAVLSRQRHGGRLAEASIYKAARPAHSRRRSFSIGHRGAALQFPEHTREAYEAGARMGAGILECDVTFTKDLQLVCRHAQNDLHTTTNILVTPLAAKCTQAVHAGRHRAERDAAQPATRRVPHQRHHARRVQDAARQDGRLRPARPDPRSSSSAARPTSGPISTPARPAATC